MPNEEQIPPSARPDQKSPKDSTIRIVELPDLRRLRAAYLKKDGLPIGVDSNDSPVPDEQEEDLGLKRSTIEEALEFLRESTEKKPGDRDALSEFLDE